MILSSLSIIRLVFNILILFLVRKVMKIRIRFVNTVDVPKPKRHVEGGSTVRDVVHHRLLSRRKEYSGAWVWDPALLFATKVEIMVGNMFKVVNGHRVWFCSFAAYPCTPLKLLPTPNQSLRTKK